MTILSSYDANKIELKWYDYWLKNKYFKSKPDNREPYTIVIPPPNVTGVLHMGHMLNNTIQDVLIRRARLKGKNACWVPGTDHASIATEAKVVAMLKENGINKNNLSREEFLQHAWDWTDEYGGVILKQLQKLGCSCDWDRTKFTLDKQMSESVILSFIDLYNKGLIYKGFRMVNWDPKAKTTLSDEEVIYEERQGNLYYLQYQVLNSDEKLVVATTRPETIFGDTAICINPRDDRYKHLSNNKAIVPLVGKVVPIIEDEYVDMEFGTGCLKVTPAHDINDKTLGERHNLEVIDIFNSDATLNQHGLHYEGEDRFIVRKKIVKELKAVGCLIKTEQYLHKVGTSERTKEIIEPRISEQWFLKMKDLAKPALQAVLQNEKIKLFPDKFKNTYRHWMENIRDWNISRQLYWGQRIPVYYYGNGKDDFVVAKSNDEALKLVHLKTNNRNYIIDDLKQESDVLDTWFSSWIWPISVFDGIRNPDNSEIKYYYPTNDLVTGPDILFFWVARMIISGYEFKKERPFKNVYLTGLVRDKKRQKMSKSLGNSPDALKLINNYGADAVRVGLLLSSSAGNDLLFDEALCNQGKSFINKIWNSFRLIKGWEIDDIPQPTSSIIALNWYNAKFQKTLTEIEDHFSKYRLSDALMSIYKLIWDDYCSWLLEMIKPPFGKPIDKKTYDFLVDLLEKNLSLLHPFIPFISEEIWHYLKKRTKDQALIISKWPKVEPFDKLILEDFKFASDVISNIRNIRKTKQIKFKKSLVLHVINNISISSEFDGIISKLCNISSIVYTKQSVENAFSFRVKSNEYFLVSDVEIDIEREISKINEELSYTKGFLKSVQKKLSNKGFVLNAPKHIIVSEKKKEADALAKIDTLEISLKNLK
tara:strand:- start:4377 stop:7007 length:2631 start_codon:yes stop_codon:yes gene_type:complete